MRTVNVLIIVCVVGVLFSLSIISEKGKEEERIEFFFGEADEDEDEPLRRVEKRMGEERREEIGSKLWKEKRRERTLKREKRDPRQVRTAGWECGEEQGERVSKLAETRVMLLEQVWTL